MSLKIQPDKDKNVKIYTKYDVCGKCKGACCKTYAGIYSPEDFTNSVTIDYVTALLLTKRFSVDFNDAVFPTSNVPSFTDKNYFIRPRHIDESDLSIRGGICVNWDYEKGCKLSETDRPYQCRMLIPLINEGVACSHKKEDKAGTLEMANRWKPYQIVIREALRKYDYLKGLIEINQFEIDDNVAMSIEKIMAQIRLFYEQKESGLF